jgi:hypothetical protein
MITERKPDVLPDEALLTLSSSAARREKLDAQLEEFFARGGSVQQIETGQRTLDASHERPTRMDGTVPTGHLKSINTKFHIDTAEVRAMIADKKTTAQICEHYMQTLGCSKATVMAKVSSVRGTIRGKGYRAPRRTNAELQA